MKTLGRFVLIDNTNKKEIFLDWKTNAAFNRTLQPKPNNFMTYSSRKNIISDLKPIDTDNKDTAYSKKARKQQGNSASTHQLTPFFYANPQRQTTSQSKSQNKTFYRTRSVGKINNQINTVHERNRINQKKIKLVIQQCGKLKGSRIICVLKMRREGLRYRLKHDFFILETGINHQSFGALVKQKMFSQFISITDKKIYFFHLSKEPINEISTQVNRKQYVIFADISPKFNTPFDMQMKLFQQASIIQEQMRNQQLIFEQTRQLDQELGEESYLKNEKDLYEWQKIKNVKDYVERLINDPSEARKLKPDSVEKDQIQVWCQQKYGIEELKKSEKHPFFDVNSHFPQETLNSNTLYSAAKKVNELGSTINLHEIKQHPVHNMMERVRRQNEDAQRLKKLEQQKIKTVGYKSGKQFLQELDSTKIPLAYQNIPYMMEKYGINRAEAYNLFNLYKSLQKISAMRLFDSNQYRRVLEKGIDRKTFDEGLKILEINPGQEVIRNICYFPQFIKWEQFIKIISISMRKTPKSKLQAILQGLGSNGKGFLTRQQIGIMVGSSLMKIFGRDEPQLKKYFVGVVMKQLDKDKSGTIQIEELKGHVLEKGIENLDIVSYLMLNS